MSLHHHSVAALAGAAVVAAVASAGCTSEAGSAQSPVPLALQAAPAAVAHEAGEGIQALTQRVNWARVERSPDVQGF